MALPSGYTQLEYIQSTGTQYIDTNFKPNGNTRIVCDAQFHDISGEKSFTGQRNLKGTANALGWISVDGNLRAYYGTTFTVVATANTNRHVYDLNKNVVSIDGTVLHTHNASSFSGSYSFYLFAFSESATPYYRGNMTLYSCQIYDNGTLVRNFVPARRNSDSTAGLYDTVNNVFYTNAGTGVFQYKTLVSDLPDGYTKLEYIQSSGTQYIDTGVRGKSGIKATGKFALAASGSSIPLGCYSPERCYLISISASNVVQYGYVDWYYSSKTLTVGTPYKFEVDFSAGQQSMKIDGDTVASSNNAKTFTNGYNIFAFAYCDAGPAGDFAKIRFYALKLFDGGILVRDFIPAMRNSDGVLGLYDGVYGVFYTNGGSGIFVAGPEVATSAHTTLIDGTVYEIARGEALVEGTVYGIVAGKTLVGGTICSIGFRDVGENITYTVEIMNQNIVNDAVSYIMVNGTKINLPNKIEVVAGTVIQILAKSGRIYLNGSVVHSGSAVYEYTVKSNVQLTYHDYYNVKIVEV